MLQIQDISFSYQNLNQKAVDSLSFSVEKGEIIAVVGESGSGKSTLLKLIYGLLDCENGEIWFEDNRILGPKFNLVPGEEHIKYLAQNLDLVTYSSVYDNVGTFISNIHQDFKQRRVHTILKGVGLLEYKDEIPKNLSGGQQQRVALARAIAKTPKLLILDEPFSNIDAILKLELRDNLFELFKKLGIAIIFSTHDLNDALGFADKILVMKNGKMLQFDTPKNLYENPKNLYVAQLLGYATEFTPEEALQILGIESDRNLILFPEQINVQDILTDFQIKKSIFMGSHTILKIKVLDKIVYINAI